MSVVTKIQPIDRDLVIRLVGTPQQRSAAFAKFAREKLAEGEEINRAAIGQVPPHKTFVDGAEGRQEESVNPDGGVIVYEFDIVSDILSWISIALEESSPVGSNNDPHPGLYSHSHALFADGALVDPASPPSNVSEYIFMNSQPYARKIERGFSNQFPDGVYQVVAVLAQGYARQHSNSVRITFSYRSLMGGAIGAWAQTLSARNLVRTIRRGNPSYHTEWLTRQPCIIVTPR